jgi:hypothetical protein
VELTSEAPSYELGSFISLAAFNVNPAIITSSLGATVVYFMDNHISLKSFQRFQ